MRLLLPSVTFAQEIAPSPAAVAGRLLTKQFLLGSDSDLANHTHLVM